VDGFIVTGYLNHSQDFTQPFTEDNMVLIYNGDCASACAHFSELMKVQTRVPSVVFGGRPQYGQMQAVGSVRGFDVIEFLEIKSITTGSLEIAKLHNISVPESLTLPSTADSPLEITWRALIVATSSDLVMKLILPLSLCMMWLIAGYFGLLKT
jgi:hypothetical protein